MQISNLKRNCAIVLSAALVPFAGYSSAEAAYTTIHPPYYTNEASVAQILAHTYGTPLTPVGLDYAGTGVTALRVMDSVDLGGGSMQSIAAGGGGSTGVSTALDITTGISASSPTTDQYWIASGGNANARAAYASLNEAFGYFTGTSDGTYHPILNVTGTGFDIDSTNHSFVSSDTLFRFGRNGTNGLFSSANSDNRDAVDHMVTYQVQLAGDLATTRRYMIFFEDTPADGPLPDFDFNDMAIEVVLTNSVAPAPEPVALSTMAAVGGVALLRARRRKA